MIELRNLSKGYWVYGVYRPVFRNLNLHVPTGQSLALLGGNGAGKSTLLKTVSGVMRPDSGEIITDGTISFTVGYSGSFHSDMTGLQNTRFIARLYGVDTDELVDFVEDFAEIGEYFHLPLRMYSSGMKSRLAFGISMGLRFDTYIIDEATATGDKGFREKARILFRNRMKDASAIVVTHRTSEVRRLCDAAVVLYKGKVEVYDDIEDALERHKEILMRKLT